MSVEPQKIACKSCGAPMESSTSEICPKCLLGIGMETQIEKPLDAGMEFHGLEITPVARPRRNGLRLQGAPARSSATASWR